MTRRPSIRLRGAQAAGFFLLSLLLTAGKVELKPGEILLQDAVTYREEGRRLQDAGELQRASAAFRRAVTLNPDYAEAYNDLGVVLESLGDLSAAEQAYKEALALKPDFASTHSNLALLYEEMGRPKEAGEHWAARIRLGPSDDPWVLRAREKMARHEIPVQDTPLESAEKRKQAVRLAILAGQSHMDSHRWDDAAREFQRALDLEPGNAKANRLLNVSLLKSAEGKRKLDREMERAQGRVVRERELVEKESQGRQIEAARRKEEAARQAGAAVKPRRTAAARPEEPGRPWWRFWAPNPERQRRLEEQRRLAEERHRQAAQEEALRKAGVTLLEPAAVKPAPVKVAASTPPVPAPKPAAPKPAAAVVVPRPPALSPVALKPVALKPVVKAAPEPSPAEVRRLAEEYARERSQSTQGARDELYQRGVTAMREGDYAQAAEHFRQVLALDPSDTYAQQALARAERAREKEQQDQGLGDY